MSTDSGEELAVLEPAAFLRALKRVVVRILALQEALQGQIIKDDTLRRNFASAVLRLYEHEEALLVSLLHNAINQAIRLPETESLMLREGSLMVDFLSEFAKQATAPQRGRMQPLVQKMVKDNAPMEVDPARLGLTLSQPDGEVPPALRQARENLLQCATAFLNTIIASVEATPRAFKKVIRIVFESAEARFPGSGYRTLGGVIFLRLFCPAIVAPEASQLTSSAVPPSVRRSLILVAKLLQSLVNESTLEKEEYMLCFNPWIQENVATIHMAFLSWVSQGASKHQQGDSESGETSPQSSPRNGQNERSAEWRLSSSSISSSSSSDSCDPPSFTENLDEASVQVIEEGLKESMAVLQAYQEDMAVMVAIRRLDARYREVQHSLRALFAASHPDSPASMAAALQQSIGSAPNSTTSPYNRFSMSSPTVLTRAQRHRSAEQLSNSDDVDLAKPKLGSFIGRFSGRSRSASKSGGGKDASLDIVRWDRKQVCAWLQTLGLEDDVIKDYSRAFNKQNMTGLRLQQLTREILNDLGIKRLGDRKKILAQAQELYRERLASVQVKDMEDWSVEDVVAWLGTNELTEYQELWLKDQVDGQTLLEAVQLDNVQRLSVTKCGHRKRLVRLVRERSSLG